MNVMQDQKTTIDDIKKIVAQFVQEREWHQFHSPKNLSMNMSIEAAELMEKFLWIDSAESHDELQKNRQEIEDELADVFMGILCFANVAHIDLATALKNKMAEAAQKYPVDKAKGRSTKYNKL